nr:rRNA adenine N-6-methyltransferase family protein [Candidatus Sigynarchaeota archaeon]
MVPADFHFLTESEVKRVLASLSQIAKHQYGQNFLVARPTIEHVIDACDIREGDAFLEIGPGLGALTFNLASRGARVRAIELNKAFTDYLRSRAIELSLPSIEITNADALDVEFPAGMQIISSMPYSIAGPLTIKISRYLHERSSPGKPVAFIICQKEFAGKLLAQPGSEEYSRITAITSFLAGITRVFDISRGSFYPVPKVDSTLVKLVLRHLPAGIKLESYVEVVTGIFPYKNKLIQKAFGFFLKSEYPNMDPAQILHDIPFSGSRVRDLDVQALETLSVWWAGHKPGRTGQAEREMV